MCVCVCVCVSVCVKFLYLRKIANIVAKISSCTFNFCICILTSTDQSQVVSHQRLKK